MIRNFNTEIKTVAPSYCMQNAHCHKFCELYFMIDGCCTVTVGDCLFKLESGSAMVIPANTPHKTTYLSANSNTRAVTYFEESELDWIAGNTGDVDILNQICNIVIKIPKKSSDFFSGLLNRIRYEKKGVDNYSAALIRTYFYEAILYMLRCRIYKDNVIQKTDVSNAQIQKVIDYILSHYASDITLHDTAKLFAMSDSSLSKKFKQFTGHRFKEYVINVRLHAAEDMLINTACSITEIAEKCGFSSNNSFSDTFKRIYKTSPSDYRKLR